MLRIFALLALVAVSVAFGPMGARMVPRAAALSMDLDVNLKKVRKTLSVLMVSKLCTA